MIICTSMFMFPDPKNPDYAMNEPDVYGHMPGQQKTQHRLSIRKNLKKNVFEAYRHYFLRDGNMASQDEVVCTGTLREVIDFTNAEVKRVWGPGFANQDQVCDHKKVIARHCLEPILPFPTQ